MLKVLGEKAARGAKVKCMLDVPGCTSLLENPKERKRNPHTRFELAPEGWHRLFLPLDQQDRTGRACRRSRLRSTHRLSLAPREGKKESGVVGIRTWVSRTKACVFAIRP